MYEWVTSLSVIDALDDAQRLRLQAVAITSVEELQYSIYSDPEPMAQLLGVSDLRGLEPELIGFTADAALQFAALDGAPPSLGAAPPPEVAVLEVASTEILDTTIASLTVTPLSPQLAPPTTQVFLGSSLQPIRSQGGRGTCVAHAVCAVAEQRIRAAGGDPVDLSPQWLYWACKEIDGIPDDSGTYVKVAVERAVSVGLCAESAWPYNPNPVPGDEGQGPPPQRAVDDAAGRKSTGFDHVPERSSSEIRTRLDGGVAVAFSIPVYAAWTNPTGKIPMPIPGARIAGGHAMCAAGYITDATAPGGGLFIVKNSWGTSHAPSSPVAPGYFSLPFDYIDQYGWETYVLA